MSNQTYFIIAGVNGAGKSTIYGIIKDKYNGSIYINPDIIAARINQDVEKAHFEAGKISVQLIKECIKNKESFVQETTLSGRSTIKFMQKAKQQGFSIDVTYIGLNSPEKAKQRVQNRVLNGGHNIPENDIERRYKGSLENLNEAIKLCDTITIYDNSDRKYEAILEKEKGKINFLSNKMPDWLIKVNNQEINKAYAEQMS